MKLKRYLLVAKPGIIFGNLIAVAGGYFLAARGSVEPMLLLATVIGLSLVVASGCVLNLSLIHILTDAQFRSNERRASLCSASR